MRVLSRHPLPTHSRPKRTCQGEKTRPHLPLSLFATPLVFLVLKEPPHLRADGGFFATYRESCAGAAREGRREGEGARGGTHSCRTDSHEPDRRAEAGPTSWQQRLRARDSRGWKSGAASCVSGHAGWAGWARERKGTRTTGASSVSPEIGRRFIGVVVGRRG